ncbi:hypothetical protein K440DRAFT_609087 [Wilcoxina mikolae CBS 423.85]|nr:hypothetical protein K440DRAFT_609087 [Wilcoxina mikolae CBS 423.85]
MGPESIQGEEWASPPRNSSSPLRFDNTFSDGPNDLASSDASSTTTLATPSTTALNTGEESSSSLRTTPEIGNAGGEEDFSKLQEALELTAQVSKQIESEAAQVQNTVAANKEQTSTTRRRSMRIKSKESQPATTAAAAPIATTQPPITPHPRPKVPRDTTSTSPDATITKRSLRSSLKKPKEEPDTGPTGSTPLPEPAMELGPQSANEPEPSRIPELSNEPQSSKEPEPLKEPEPSKEPEPTRRTSKRISAINSLLIKSAETPSGNSSKRAHGIMDEGSKSAGAVKKPKLEEDKETDGALSTRFSEAPSAVSDEPTVPRVRRKKVWLDQGLYVGQEDCDLKLRPATKGKKSKGKKGNRPPILPLPLFRGREIMETQRDFKLPHAVFAPSAYKCPHPQDWRKLNHNQLIGDAQQIWRKEKPSTVKCVCTIDCSEQCLNRCTWVECTDNTCNLGRNCKNRSFADLIDRVKTETRFATGVEVALTSDRGYGLRATRSFEPGQIIVEYTGEIITQEESERRLEEVYKDNTNYYLMLFDQNMILDATRGSVARFVNHSCEPNCTMEKWVVEGRPRMALFAGDTGIEAGDELTYDYNFTWFKGVTQTKCKCGSEKCRGVLGKRSDRKGTTPPKKLKLKAKAVKMYKKYKKAVVERIQKSVIIGPVKPKRKPPRERRPPSPPPPSKSATPELEPLAQTSDDDSGLSDIEMPTPVPKVPSPKPLLKSLRPRVRPPMKTYKINKTIAQSSVLKSVTSKNAVVAARTSALEQALAEVTGEEAAKSVSNKTHKSITITTTEDASITSITAVEEILPQGVPVPVDELLPTDMAMAPGTEIAVGA